MSLLKQIFLYLRFVARRLVDDRCLTVAGQTRQAGQREVLGNRHRSHQAIGLAVLGDQCQAGFDAAAYGAADQATIAASEYRRTGTESCLADTSSTR